MLTSLRTTLGLRVCLQTVVAIQRTAAVLNVCAPAYANVMPQAVEDWRAAVKALCKDAVPSDACWDPLVKLYVQLLQYGGGSSYMEAIQEAASSNPALCGSLVGPFEADVRAGRVSVDNAQNFVTAMLYCINTAGTDRRSMSPFMKALATTLSRHPKPELLDAVLHAAVADSIGQYARSCLYEAPIDKDAAWSALTLLSQLVIVDAQVRVVVESSSIGCLLQPCSCCCLLLCVCVPPLLWGPDWGRMRHSQLHATAPSCHRCPCAKRRHTGD